MNKSVDDFGNVNCFIILKKRWGTKDFMKKKWKIIISLVIIAVLLIIGYVMTFPKWLFPTYIETIESNWDISLPNPDSKKYILDSRGGFHGDGDAITELQYNHATDIQHIKGLTDKWVSGEKFEIKKFPTWVQDLIKNIDKDAWYFYLQESKSDYIIFELKGNKLIIYESYL